MTKIASKLPTGYRNGLAAINQALIDDPDHAHILICLVDCKSTTTDNDTGETEPTIRIRQIQPVLDDDRITVAALLQRASDVHAGKMPLPFDMYATGEGEL